MSQEPVGRIECREPDPMLIYERHFSVPIEEVWGALTISDRTGRWIGSWSGTPGAGDTVQVAWTAEEGAPVEEMTIVECIPPRLLTLLCGPDLQQQWLVTVELRNDAGGTWLEFRQPMRGDANPTLVGTGWEYYLDRLTGVLVGDDELPVWDERYFSMQPHYEELQAAMATCADRTTD